MRKSNSKIIGFIGIISFLAVGMYIFISSEADVDSSSINVQPQGNYEKLQSKKVVVGNLDMDSEIDLYKQIESKIDSAILKNVDPELNNLLSADNELKQKIKRIVLMVRHTDEIDEELKTKLAKKYRDFFVENREESIFQVKEYLQVLSSIDYAHEHFGLLAVIGVLPDNEEVVKEIAIKESLTMISPKRPDIIDAFASQQLKDEAYSWDPRYFLPLNTHKAFIKVAGNSDEALSVTKDVLLAQQDTQVRRVIASITAAEYPEVIEDLNEFLSLENINLGGEFYPKDSENKFGVVTENVEIDS